ncbi:hypothetical protein HII12_004479 [Brettanomyces bruxellensis]|uniref:Transcription factor IIIA n=1 Tax=Dekkera bruxellensis TaxID=5007 RepID=A0A8H6BA26_DEKBR|nr:hypothetical protein HII12_004479 [Brettanomyces bruxellensis]
MQTRNTENGTIPVGIRYEDKAESVSNGKISASFDKFRVGDKEGKVDKKAKGKPNKAEAATQFDDEDEEYIPNAKNSESDDSNHEKSSTPTSSNETQAEETPRKRRKYTFRKRKPATGKKKVHNYPRPKRYVCLIPGCGKAYTRPSLLEQHQRTHTGERPFVCQYPGCNQAFTRKDHLRRHQLKHLDEKDKPFHCSVCGKGVNSKQHLKRHEKTHYKSFHCDYPGCNESFYKHQSLKAHQRAVHDDRQLKCPKCDKTFSRPGRLNSHLKKHHKDKSRFVCEYPECLQSFKTWSALQLHIKGVHPKLECPTCGRKCVGPSGLKNHMKVHDEATVIKLWVCPSCDKKYLRKNELYDHFVSEHPGDEVPAFLVRDSKKDEMKRDEMKKDGNGECKFVEGEDVCVKNVKNEDVDVKNEDLDVKNEDLDVKNEDVDVKNKCLDIKNEDMGAKNEDVNSGSDAEKKPFSLAEKVDGEINFLVSKYNGETFTKAVKRREIESSPMDLIINNVDNRLACEYENCHRLFRRNYDLQRHLDWHHKQDAKLEDKVRQINAEN